MYCSRQNSWFICAFVILTRNIYFFSKSLDFFTCLSDTIYVVRVVILDTLMNYKEEFVKPFVLLSFIKNNFSRSRGVLWI